MSAHRRLFAALCTVATAGVALAPAASAVAPAGAPVVAAAGVAAYTTPEPGTVTTLPGVTPLARRGALPVGTAAYPVPANAIFVDAAKGNDANPGTLAAPKRTLAKGISAAPAGGTVVLRGGVYHENVFIGKAVTVQNYPNEEAWLDGSVPVTTWTKSGTTWTAPWTVRFDSSGSFTIGGTSSEPDPFVNAQYPMAAWPDMVFVDGVQLKQVDGVKTPVTAGTFAVDYTNGKLTIGSDPTGHEVRASDLAQAIVSGSPDVTIQGIGVRRYANSVPKQGALYMARQRDVVRNVVIEDVATTGITFTSDKTNGAGMADQITVRRAGLTGIHGHWADGLVIKNSVVNYANNEHFNAAPSAAGMKVTSSRNITIDNNKVMNTNNANGIWLDMGVVNFKVTHNQTNAGYEAGIEAELSSSGLIASNHVMGNKRGIFLLGTEKTEVVNNTLGYNSLADIYILQDYRRQATFAPSRDSRYPAGDPTNTWITRDISLRNNIFGPEGTGSSYFQVYALDNATNRTADSMNITMEGNAFQTKTAANQSNPIGWGQGDNKTLVTYGTWDAFAAAKGRTTPNSTYAGTLDLGGLTTASRFQSTAWPISATAATPMGVAAGTKITGALNN